MMMVVRSMATAICERAAEWKPWPALRPWIWTLVLVVVIVVLTASGEHRMRRALLFEICDEVPEGSCLIVVSY